MLFGLEDCKNFHKDQNFYLADGIPIISIGSGAIHIVAAVMLVAINALKAVGFAIAGLVIYACSKGEDVTWLNEAADSAFAVGYSVAMVGYGVFVTIPVVGNIPSWVHAAKKIFFFA